MIDGSGKRKAHYLVVDLPQSDDCFVMAFPAETTEVPVEFSSLYTTRSSL